MMGRQHVLSGAAAYAATAPAVGYLLPGLPTLTPGQMILGMGVCAGAAVLPDIDHPNSGITMTFGPLTKAFSWIVAKASGGHRNGTHSFLGAAVFNVYAFAAAAIYATDWRLLSVGLGLSLMLAGAGLFCGSAKTNKRPKRSYRKRWHGYAAAGGAIALPAAAGLSTLRFGSAAGTLSLGLLLALTLAAAVRVMKIKGWVDDAIPLVVAVGCVYLHIDLAFIPYAVILGVLTHIAGDSITLGGCPLGWPWSQSNMGLMKIRTNGAFERGPIAIALVFMLALGVGWNVHLYSAM
jgi:membrane-bound metal-dependent hydrolase YbcI (DUF457 family)